MEMECLKDGTTATMIFSREADAGTAAAAAVGGAALT